MRNETEQQIQGAFFSWLALHEKKYPQLSLFYAVPNGSYKSFTARMVHQATGLKPGVPDCHLPVASGSYHGLWIEFKSKAGRLSEAQQKWIFALDDQLHRVKVCRSWVDAANTTIEYLNLPIQQIRAEI